MLETERLLLREINLDDAESIYKLDNDENVQRFTGDYIPKSVNDVKNRIEKISHTDYKINGFGRMAVILKSTDLFIGWAGLKYLPEYDSVDLGYRFFPEHWNKGYATESSREILKYGFETLGLKNIIAIAMKENVASIAVMKKVGMHFDKFAPYEEGDADDAIWYKMSIAEYEAQNTT